MLSFCFRNPTGSCLLLRGGYNGLTSALAKMMKKRPVNKDVMSSWDVWKPFGFKASSEEQQIQIKFLIKVWQNWDFLFFIQIIKFCSFIWDLRLSHICDTCRDWWSAGLGDAWRVDESADVSTGPTASLSLTTESDSGPQPAEPRSPAALLAPPP